MIVDFTTTAAMSFQIGLNNTQLQNYTIWKWSSGANLTNDLSIPFGLNNFDGNMRNCPVGHCGVFKVKNDTAFVFDNCCSQVSSRYICSRYVDTQEKTNDVHIIIDWNGINKFSSSVLYLFDIHIELSTCKYFFDMKY